MAALPESHVRLHSGELSADIDPRGAQLSALRDREGRDLLWNGDPAVWAGRAPILFPIVGVLVGGTYHLGSKSYSLPRHGFARNRMFSTESADPTETVFRLSDDDETLRVYPFRFNLDMQFKLIGPTLSVTASIHNRGDEIMPASFGFHPAFRWPLPYGQPRAAHFIEFAADEPDPVRRLDAAGLLTPVHHPTPIVQRRLLLKDELFEGDALILDRIRSRSVIYGAAAAPRLQVRFADAPFLGIWSKPGAHFICIEPWHGISDAAGFSGDFRDKSGVELIAAGDSFSTTMAISLLDEA
jgi:galactose mutarotase-like enzyme